MALETRSTDAKGRVSLPKEFANATVIIEQVNENEIRIRKARVIPEDSCGSSRKHRSSCPIGIASSSFRHRSPAQAQRRAAASDGGEGQEAWMSPRRISPSRCTERIAQPRREP